MFRSDLRRFGELLLGHARGYALAMNMGAHTPRQALFVEFLPAGHPQLRRPGCERETESLRLHFVSAPNPPEPQWDHKAAAMEQIAFALRELGSTVWISAWVIGIALVCGVLLARMQP